MYRVFLAALFLVVFVSMSRYVGSLFSPQFDAVDPEQRGGVGQDPRGGEPAVHGERGTSDHRGPRGGVGRTGSDSGTGDDVCYLSRVLFVFGVPEARRQAR